MRRFGGCPMNAVGMVEYGRDDYADADRVRTESRYLVSGGSVTLVGRTWTRYTHGAADGHATVTVETTAAGAQDAAIGDPRNAVAVETRYDGDAAGVPLVENFYDAKSRRVRKVTREAAATFFYDGWDLVEERVAYANGRTTMLAAFTSPPSYDGSSGVSAPVQKF